MTADHTTTIVDGALNSFAQTEMWYILHSLDPGRSRLHCRTECVSSSKHKLLIHQENINFIKTLFEHTLFSGGVHYYYVRCTSQL